MVLLVIRHKFLGSGISPIRFVMIHSIHPILFIGCRIKESKTFIPWCLDYKSSLCFIAFCLQRRIIISFIYYYQLRNKSSTYKPHDTTTSIIYLFIL